MKAFGSFWLALAAALPLATAPATTSADESSDVAEELGVLLASEEFCGLTYDQEAVAAFITTRIDPSDLAFADNLRMETDLAAFSTESMTPSSKTAHCTAITQSARHYGLTKP